ncbi:dihydrolipoamide acetyltransferase family protein [Actinospica sp.]|uniref:dihydrolipoamide acetyltransferase family protein n=1 Tax=Actinospica sp. TaxID=1872142 RepID=UPI002C59F058|nr:dihydrolipoamide acetyltransferase family protein [Actinospica sp.]HWG23666.1 dihydrolipoamide acetyltransferase family protein [Actinospica sp.]
MPELLRMPEVATGTEEAHLSAWAVAENQTYAATDVIVHVETAKAAVDVEAETDGVILKALVPPGTDVQVGDPIALIGRPGESIEDIDAELARLGVGVGVGAGAADNGTGSEFGSGSTNGNGRVFASPIARRLAKDAKLDIAQLTGTGPAGRIVRSDVTRAIALHIPPQSSIAQPEPASVPTPTAAAQSRDGRSEIPHTKFRRLIATRLTESKATIPHFYLRASVRADRLLKLRAELNAALPVRVSVNDLILKAVAVAHTQVPEVNVIWTETGLRQYGSVNLGVAIASPKGLVTPVIAQVERLSIGTLAETTRDLARRASEGQLKQAELEGGTSTVSNLGMYGTEEFTAIINPPQSSILAVGAARPEADVTRRGAVKVRTKIRVVLSVDHRAIDGALAAQWMSVFRDAVEAPLRLLG